MSRILAIIGLAFATLGGAVAGNIVPIDLTTAPVGVCTNVGSNCTVSSTTTGTFENQLFSTIIPPTPPTPGPAAQTVGPTSFILNAQSGGLHDDTYVSSNTTNLDTSIMVDLGTCTGAAPSSACGLQNVDDLYTMIQASGAFGFQGVTITLNGVASDGTTPITDTIGLTSGIDYRTTNNANVANVTCTDANSVSPFTSCAGANSDTASTSGTDSSVGGGNTVVTYNNGFGPLTNTHDYYLDVQELELGTNFLGGAYLDSVTITNDSPSGGKTQIVFSGLTADQFTGDAPTSAPEPDAVVLFSVGFGLIAFWKIRSRTNRLPALD